MNQENLLQGSKWLKYFDLIATTTVQNSNQG